MLKVILHYKFIRVYQSCIGQNRISQLFSTTCFYVCVYNKHRMSQIYKKDIYRQYLSQYE